MDAPRKTIRRGKELRTTMSPPEVIVWQALRRNHLQGLRFRRQHPLGPYILDFCCDSLKLCVEVDGGWHDQSEQIRHDQRRDSWLRRQGVTVHRISARMIYQDLTRVLEGIAGVASEIAQGPLRRAARDTSPKGGGVGATG